MIFFTIFLEFYVFFSPPVCQVWKSTHGLPFWGKSQPPGPQFWSFLVNPWNPKMAKIQTQPPAALAGGLMYPSPTCMCSAPAQMLPCSPWMTGKCHSWDILKHTCAGLWCAPKTMLRVLHPPLPAPLSILKWQQYHWATLPGPHPNSCSHSYSFIGEVFELLLGWDAIK